MCLSSLASNPVITSLLFHSLYKSEQMIWQGSELTSQFLKVPLSPVNIQLTIYSNSDSSTCFRIRNKNLIYLFTFIKHYAVELLPDFSDWRNFNLRSVHTASSVKSWVLKNCSKLWYLSITLKPISFWSLWRSTGHNIIGWSKSSCRCPKTLIEVDFKKKKKRDTWQVFFKISSYGQKPLC